MPERRGTVFIAPAAIFPADGRMVDPESGRFWVSWQNDDDDEGLIADDEIIGAEAAIAWARERSSDVVIRLGHRGDTYFWAGEGVEPVEDSDDEPLPVWPPAGPPPSGWYTPPEFG
jgi:hypothetical protein